MTLQVESPCVYTSQGVPISVTGIAQVKIQGQNEDMLLTACEQFLGKSENEIQHIALVTLEGHQRAIMGSMTVEEIYKDRKKFSKQVFEVASSDLVNMGITVVSYTLKDIRDEEVTSTQISLFIVKLPHAIRFYFEWLMRIQIGSLEITIILLLCFVSTRILTNLIFIPSKCVNTHTKTIVPQHFLLLSFALYFALNARFIRLFFPLVSFQFYNFNRGKTKKTY